MDGSLNGGFGSLSDGVAGLDAGVIAPQAGGNTGRLPVLTALFSGLGATGGTGDRRRRLCLGGAVVAREFTRESISVMDCLQMVLLPSDEIALCKLSHCNCAYS